MSFSTYDKFVDAINNNELQNIENILASSDIRCELITHSIKYFSEDKIISIIGLLQSKGLREQLLKVCSNCTNNDCQFNTNTNTSLLKKSYQNTENIVSNFEQHRYINNKHKNIQELY